MASCSDLTLFIVNPYSAAGRTAQRWRKLETRVKELFPAAHTEFTTAPRHAESLAAQGAARGFRRIVSVGGDGTLSEVASGVLRAEAGERVEIGVLSMGTGSDFARTLGVPRAARQSLEQLVRGGVRRVDAGRVHYVDHSGTPRTSYFCNVASFGISGLTDRYVQQASKLGGGFLSFAAGAVRSILSYRAMPVELRLDGRCIHDGGLVLAAAANGRFFGGGMQVAPMARPDDGQLEVVVVRKVGKLALLAQFPKLYRGTHLGHPAVTHASGRRLEAYAVGGAEVLLDLDGEPLGRLPVEIEVLPRALGFFGVKAAS